MRYPGFCPPSKACMAVCGRGTIMSVPNPYRWTGKKLLTLTDLLDSECSLRLRWIDLLVERFQPVSDGRLREQVVPEHVYHS